MAAAFPPDGEERFGLPHAAAGWMGACAKQRMRLT